jgi:hypothetical protein
MILFSPLQGERYFQKQRGDILRLISLQKYISRFPKSGKTQDFFKGGISHGA